MTPSPPTPTRWRKTAGWVVAVAVLVLVFLAYLDPHTVADLSNRLWSCF